MHCVAYSRIYSYQVFNQDKHDGYINKINHKLYTKPKAL